KGYGVIVRDKHVLHCVVVAPGPSQSYAIPCVDDLGGRCWKEHDARLWHSLWSLERRTAIKDLAAADEPRTVVTTTAEGPPSGDAIASIYEHCRSRGLDRAAGHNAEIAPEDVRGAFLFHITGKRTVAPANH